MGNTMKTSEKLQRKNSFLRQSNSTSIPEQEEHIYSIIDSDQVRFLFIRHYCKHDQR